jgi:hypothetical protein
MIERVKGATNKQFTRAARFPALNEFARRQPGLRRLVRTMLPHRQQIRLTRALSREVERDEIPDEVRRRLHAIFSESIGRTEEITGLDLSAWRPSLNAA